jgi:hypothetical protein
MWLLLYPLARTAFSKALIPFSHQQCRAVVVAYTCSMSLTFSTETRFDTATEIPVSAIIENFQEFQPVKGVAVENVDDAAAIEALAAAKKLKLTRTRCGPAPLWIALMA